MENEITTEITRRKFLAAAGLTFAGACLRTKKASLPKKITLSKMPSGRRPPRRSGCRLSGATFPFFSAPAETSQFSPGRTEILVVDAEIVTARPNVSTALASVNADPIKQLINTHWHFDHAGGNAWLHEAGASILAQENTRKHLSKDTRVEGWHYTFPAMPAGALPSTVFREDYTLHANDSTLVMKHYSPAHTDSDIDVHFVEADILHVGDTFWNRNYPFIDYSTGGSIDGQIRAAEANLAKVTDKMLVIPGHGEVSGKADLVLFRDVLAGIRDKVASA